MSSITKEQAQILTNQYINFGNANHFKYNLRTINAYLFTRGELRGLLSGNPDKTLFIMLALSPSGGAIENKRLNVILGSVLNYGVDTSNLIYNIDPPFMGLVRIPENALITSDKQIITPDKLRELHESYKSSIIDPLTSTVGVKVKGYTVSRADLTHVGLLAETGQDTDKFVFIPVIRDTYESPYDRNYLSIAIAGVEDYTEENILVSRNIAEYCLPCPSACPNNYPFR